MLNNNVGVDSVAGVFCSVENALTLKLKINSVHIAFLFRYNKMSRNIRDLAQKIRDLDEKDGFRAQSTHRLLEKL